ncbi:MAG: hypothetical protein O2944_08060 [Proteobacteria bacterium]|nr:hypothetical protein [Pseudomonadota bacterium]
MKAKSYIGATALAVMMLLSGPAQAIESVADAIDRVDTVLADLGRLKALKLTPEDIQEVKAMRDEAAEAERAGDSERAVTVLQQILDILGID